MSNYFFGPAMIPDKKIYRNPNNAINTPHYVFFDAETIDKLRTRFHENNYDNRVNINHDGVQVNGVTMTKSFILDDENRKAIQNEFKHLPNGTWMIEYEIENEEIWKMVEAKKLKGFSIEGVFKYGDEFKE